MTISNPQLQNDALINKRYKVERRLGAGGMGEVYLATDQQLNRRVALKILPTKFTTDKDSLVRFKQEARAASALNHPNIIIIYDIGQEGSMHFIVTEFVEGESLRHLILRATIGVSDALDIAVQVAEALGAAHQANIVHRDIKPENIMLRPDGRVKVLDFGLAKLTGPQTPSQNLQLTTEIGIKTEPGLVMGTPYYMSPEQARGDTIDKRTDIFSLGVVIYEMIANCRPFEGRTVSDIIVSLLNEEPAPLKTYSPGISDELQRIVNTALSKTKDNRYQDASTLSGDLKKLQQLSNEQSKLLTQIQASGQPTILTDAKNPNVGGDPVDLKKYEFETVILNARGAPVQRRKGHALHFVEKLTNHQQLNMIAIPEGTFLMGSPNTEEGRDNDKEEPQHRVTVPPFYISKFPITNGQWDAVVEMNVKGGTIGLEKSPWNSSGWLTKINVSWEEAMEFCDRLTWVFMREYRLPTEAEWEYACRAGTTTPFCFGETIVARVANFSSDFPYKSAMKAPPRKGLISSTSMEGVNPFGLYDMHGNVWEWCLDKWHNNYQGAPTDGSSWEDDVKYKDGEDWRVLRGGSWNSPAVSCRSAARTTQHANKKFNDVGFRVVIPMVSDLAVS